jgi:two-component system sensor histidine kinase BarA
MSHELRTPLSTVVGYARLMRESETPAQRAEFYRPIAQASGILQRTVDDILELVRLESGAVSLERRPFELAACIEDAALMFAPAAHRKGLALVCHLGPGLGARVSGDAIRLSQVLANLLSNAVKFTEQGGVELLADLLERGPGKLRVRIEVRDTGTGIAPEGVAQLFQPFTQADESITRRFGGSGLGLSISALILSALQGSIRLESELGEGTRAVVELPLELAAEEQPATEARGLCVRVLADAASPHLQVVQDYLQHAGCRLDLRQGSLSGFPVPDLTICIEDQPLLMLSATSGAVLRLLPVEQTGSLSADELSRCLALPVRRRELIAACVRMAGRTQARNGYPDEPLAAPRQRLSLRCLLVEDNELNRRMLATSLADTGITVLDASGGKEALALLQVHSVDLVLLDVHMPGMDGVSLAREIRKRDPVLPLYALTANVIGSEERALRDAGVAEILYKPVDEGRLQAVLLQHEECPDCSLMSVPGISPGEVLAELQRLERALTQALADGVADQALEIAHQLLGAARLFTRGELAPRCLALEMAARNADVPAAFALLTPLRHALHRLLAHAAQGPS